MERVLELISAEFGFSKWNITRPRGGHQKECYIAQTAGLSLFIKFDVPVKVLKYLGEIGIAPKVLASGRNGARTYVIQEFIEGIYPDRQWFTHNLEQLSRLLKRYHNDVTLKSLLSQNQPLDYASHLTKDLTELEKQFTAAKNQSGDVGAAFESLKKQAQRLEPVPLVPVHPEPNFTNMLVAGEQLVIVDWDEVLLSDPLRDIGLILWWYVPPSLWPTFFENYGLAMNNEGFERLYWWVARTSLGIALWQHLHGHNNESFLTDFYAALSREGNPQAKF